MASMDHVFGGLGRVEPNRSLFGCSATQSAFRRLFVKRVAHGAAVGAPHFACLKLCAGEGRGRPKRLSDAKRDDSLLRNNCFNIRFQSTYPKGKKYE